MQGEGGSGRAPHEAAVESGITDRRTAKRAVGFAASSCVACKRLRVKCSNERPCAKCVSQNIVCEDKVRLEPLLWSRCFVETCLRARASDLLGAHAQPKETACTMCRTMRTKCDKQRPCSRCVSANLASACSSVEDLMPSRKRARTDPTCPEASALPMPRVPDVLGLVHPLKHRAPVQTASAFSEQGVVGADSALRGDLAAACARDTGESQEAMVKLSRLPAACFARPPVRRPCVRLPAKVGPHSDSCCHSLGCQAGAQRQRATGYEPA